jgi:hypothetical protein
MTKGFNVGSAEALLNRDIARYGEPAQPQQPTPADTCKRLHRDDWVVAQYHFSARRSARVQKVIKTKSSYSGIRCTRCGRYWRTNARYVEDLPRQGKS